MKQYYAAKLNVDEEITDFFMVKRIAIKTGSNRKQYLDVVLGDCTGEISSKKWDLADEEIRGLGALKEGDIVKVRGKVNEWNSLKQLVISRIRKYGAGDQLDISDFVKAAPEPPEEMYAYILGRARSIADADLRELCIRNLEDNRDRLMYYPAAQKNHHAEMAGLLWHVKRMLQNGDKVCEVYDFLDPDLLACGVILHDIQKLNEIESNELGISSGYSFEGILLGHLVQGVRELDAQMREMGVDREKAVMVEHMILSHHYEPEFGSPKRPMFPEAEVLHYLDVLDARLFDMQDALENTDPGQFSDRVWTLNNRTIYKKSDK